MNKNLVFAAIMSSCIFAGNGFCDDWKLFGASSPTTGITEYMFYESSSILNSKNSLKFRVKTISSRNIDKISSDKSVSEKAAAKTANGYVPPITKISSTITNAAFVEEAANESTVKPSAEILYQMVCSDMKYRKITGMTYNKDGVPERRLGITSWEYIEPESNADNLAKILCGSK